MGPGGFFPTNPDLAEILGDTDLNFENFHFLFFWIPNFQISRSQISKFPEIWLGPSGLGPAWARLGPGLGPAWAQLGPSLGPAWAQLGPGWATIHHILNVNIYV